MRHGHEAPRAFSRPAGERMSGVTLRVALAVSWLAAVGYGMALVLDFAIAPGAPGEPPVSWPRGTRLARSPGLPSLVMVAHPRCPCTRASVGELARIMARLQGRLEAQVLVVQPPGAGNAWWRTDIVESAAAIPGVQILVDGDGAEARRFGAETSGHALLYDAEGQLLFSGGITGARGHAGDNAGESAIVALVEHRASSRTSGSVFGCSLHDASPAVDGVTP